MEFWQALVGVSERYKRGNRTAGRDMDGPRGTEMTERGHPQHQGGEPSSDEDSEDVLYGQNDDDKGSSVDVADGGGRPPTEIIRQGHQNEENETDDRENQRDMKENGKEEEEEEQDEDDLMEEDGEINDVLRRQDPGKMLQILTKAISEGNFDDGCKMLKALTQLRATISMHLLSVPDPCHHGNDNEPFYINVSVETVDIREGPTWRLQVMPSMTIFGMKLKVALLYGLPVCKQRWLIGKKVAADHETIGGNRILANSKLILFLSNSREPSQTEMMLIDEFRRKLLVEGIGNIELSFNETEFSKYLKEASSLQQQQQNSSHDDEQQVQYGLTADDRYRATPQYPSPQQQLPPVHQRQPVPAVPKIMPGLYEKQNVHPEDLSPRSLPEHDGQLFVSGGEGPPQRDMPYYSMNNQQSCGAPRVNPTRNQVFPPPHLVQSGPRTQLPDPPQERNQRLQRTSQMTAKKVQKPPKEKRMMPNLQNVANMRRTQPAYNEDLHLKSHDPSVHVSVPNGRTNSFPRYQPNALQGLEDAKDDIETLFQRKVQSPTVRNKKKTHRRHLRRPDDFSASVPPQDDLITAKQHSIPVFEPPDDDSQPWALFSSSNRPKRFEFGKTPSLDLPTADEDGWGFPKVKQQPKPEFNLPGDGNQRYTTMPHLPTYRRQQIEFGPGPVTDLPTAYEVGWDCPQCTLRNAPLVPGCCVCSYERPTEYKIPAKGSYVMDEDEARIQKSLQRNEAAFQMMQVREKEMQRKNARENRAKLYQATEFNLMVNEKVFECPVCFSEIEPGQGIRLQECLHELCRDCCVNHISHAEGPEVKCPYTDGDNGCQQTILDREIRQIVGRDVYDKIVERSLKKAEEVSPNTFHCLTPNCKGFCFYDEEHNFFDCPICRRMNCLTCKVVHEGQNCRQYQDDIKLKAQNDETAKQTQNALEQLLREGRAMHCPQCGVVIQKKGGCPNMTCSVCRRGFRWTGVDM